MLIRPTVESDIPGILDILNREIREGVAHFGLEEIALETQREEFEATKGRYPWFTAEHNGQVVGFSRAYGWKPRGAYNKTVEVGVYLAPDCQGKGIGAAIYGQFIPAVFAAGFHTLLAGTRLPNDPCVRLHEKFGFSYVGTFPQVGHKFGEWHDVGYWALVAGTEMESR